MSRLESSRKLSAYLTRMAMVRRIRLPCSSCFFSVVTDVVNLFPGPTCVCWCGA
jgi:hypothetical protein